MLDDYEIDWTKIRKNLKHLKAKSVFVELPEGVKGAIFEIQEMLSEFSPVFSGENVYGACDTIYTDADVTLHFGHSAIPNLDYGKKIIFVEMRRKIVIDEKRLGRMPEIGCRSVGLLATVQYIHLLPVIDSILRKKGIECIISTGDSRLAYPGQVLGCDFSAATSITASVDCFIVVADGEFHAAGIAISTGKRTYSLNPITSEIKEVNIDGFLRRRYAMVERAMKAKNVAILVSGKIGQMRISLARWLKSRLENAGKRAVIVFMNDISPQKIRNIPADIFVNTACPRISLDDEELYDYRIVTPQEMEMAIGERPLDQYAVDMINYVDSSMSGMHR